MAPNNHNGKRGGLTLATLARYDDFITDALVDRVYFWATIRKNRLRFFPSRYLREEEIIDILRSTVVIEKDAVAASNKLLNLPGIKRFVDSLPSFNEKEHFKHHLRKYVNIYMHDCPFEVSTTNRYTIDTEEAAVTARRRIVKGELIKNLSGIQVAITRKEEEDLDLSSRDFSIVMSSRKRTPSLFLGPARFANHDCDANARLTTKGSSGMAVMAVKDIEVGEEITVTYGDNYFGLDNCECLCATCEQLKRNGWLQDTEDAVDVDSGLESDQPERPYSLRNKRRLGAKSGTASPVHATPTKRLKLYGNQFQTQIESIPVHPRLEAVRATESSSRSIRASNESIPENTDGKVGATDNDVVSHGQQSPRSALATFPLPHTNGCTTVSSVADGLRHSPHGAESAFADRLSRSLEDEFFTAKDEADMLSDIVLDMTDVSSELSDAPSCFIPNGEVPLSATTKDDEEDVGLSVSHDGAPSVLSEDTRTSSTLRTPKDYILSQRLLSVPNSRWVHCGTCEASFIQTDVFQTRAECPRCERHSKLYGFRWPKTEKTGKNDTEERVMDHTAVCRFIEVDGDGEIKRGRKSLKGLLEREGSSQSRGSVEDASNNSRTRTAAWRSRNTDSTQQTTRKKPSTLNHEVFEFKGVDSWGRRNGALSNEGPATNAAETSTEKTTRNTKAATGRLASIKARKDLKQLNGVKSDNNLVKSRTPQAGFESPPAQLAKRKYVHSGLYVGVHRRRTEGSAHNTAKPVSSLDGAAEERCRSRRRYSDMDTLEDELDGIVQKSIVTRSGRNATFVQEIPGKLTRPRKTIVAIAR